MKISNLTTESDESVRKNPSYTPSHRRSITKDLLRDYSLRSCRGELFDAVTPFPSVMVTN